MSYSLNTQCHDCEKKDKCTDRHFLEGAVSGIHSVYPSDKGHLGYGSITLNCAAKTVKQVETK